MRKTGVTRHVGEVSSKYGYQPQKFNEDMERHYKRSKQLYEDFKKFMIEKNVSPTEFRWMFSQYYDDFIK